MPKLDNFFSNTKSEKIEQILTKKIHPQLISIKNLEESKLQYRDIPQEDVEKLADLIELDGEVLQPLLVRKAGADTYEILAGHKRYRACKYLSEVRKLEQFSMIPCYVKSMTDAQAEFAVYSTNGYNRKTDYEIMREVEGMSRLLKENPELFPEAASGRLVEKLAKIMNLSKTTVQEYKTIANNLSDEAMDKFKNNEITKESAKTLAGLSSDEQNKVIATGVTETKDIKEAAKIIRNPSMSEIRSAFKSLYESPLYAGYVVRKYSCLEECFKDKAGRSHSGHAEYRLNYECSMRGIKINNRKEITWHEFVTAAIEMELYNPDEVYKKPSDDEIKLAYNNLTHNVNIKKIESVKSLENYMKDIFRHREYFSSTLTYSCSYRGLSINQKEEITWHEFVMAALRMWLYTPKKDDNKEIDSVQTLKCTTGFNPNGNCVCCKKDDINCCSECNEDCNGRCGWYENKKNDDEQLPGQDDIYNHPEYLPDNIKSYSNEDNMQKADNENVTDSVTNTYTAEQPEENVVRHIKETKYLAGVEKIGNCPYCNSPLTFISNQKFCGSCGKGIVWSK